MKTCKSCGHSKPLEEFHNNKATVDGKAFYCRPCANFKQAHSRKSHTRSGPYIPNTQRRKPKIEGFGWCNDCQEYYPEEQMRKGGVYCKPCHNARTRVSIEKGGGSRRYRLKHRYGITLEQYEAMLEDQGNLCPGCGTVDPTHVDHDHACCPTKEGACGECVRGILCFRCNAALGNVGDSLEILQSLINYLNRSKGGQ